MPDVPTADQILAGLPEAVLIIDLEGQISAMNPAAEDLFGTSAKRFIGKNIDSELVFEDPRLSAIFCDTETSLAAYGVTSIIKGEPTPLDIGVELLPSDPSWRVVTLSPKPDSYGSGEQDVGNNAQFGIRAPDVLGHEIKNPLAAIRGAAQLLARKGDNKSSVHTDMIISEVDRIANLLDRMQSLSTTQPAKIQSINIHTLIDDARRSIQSATGEEIIISDSFDPSLPNVLADTDAMMQILTNLMANAIDAVSDVENPTVEIITRYSIGGSFASQQTAHTTKLPIEIVIRDNGPGVPESIRNEIFAPFVTTKSEGQGLGLALVKKLVGDMNGHIVHERLKEREFTQFTLFLPVAKGT